MALKFEDLTQEQIDYVSNGVGSDHFIINPHDLIFKEPSKKHDFLYWLGSTNEDRLAADALFYAECLELVNKYSFPRKQMYRLILEVYYFFLSKLGKSAFEYEPQVDTWQELKYRIDSKREEIKKSSKRQKKYVVVGLAILACLTVLIIDIYLLITS